MTIGTELAGPRGFAHRVLPWLAGAGGLLVYLVTLNSWVSLHSLGTVVRIAGLVPQPPLTQPLTCALLFPFRWLPEAWIPLALNLFNALCAAMVLVLLARSIALLPHDLVPDEPLRRLTTPRLLSGRAAWMPPVLAVCLCGLQISFWEAATSATGEMLDLLLLAYIIRALLEFRITGHQYWLSRCAFLYGLGMANDWVMVAGLPIFLLALLRLKGLGGFLDWRFLARIGLWGAAGLSLFLLLPGVNALTGSPPLEFLASLKANLRAEKAGLLMLRVPVIRVLALTALVPLLVLSIRWKSHTVQFGDDSPLGVFLLKATGHVVHVLMFLAALWLALDPLFAPRHLGLGTSLLSYYYLAALAFGYCAGYLLVLGAPAPKTASTPPAQRPPLGPTQTMVAATGFFLVLVPFSLLWKNLPEIRVTNGPAVREFAQTLWQDLPAGKSVVLSEETPSRLLLRLELVAHGKQKEPLLVDTTALGSPHYLDRLQAEFKSRHPQTDPPGRRAVPPLPLEPVGLDSSNLPLETAALLPQPETVTPAKLLALVSDFAAREPLFYLHPSSGLFLEAVIDEPHGAIHHLVPRPPEDNLCPRLPQGILVANQKLWSERWTNMLQALATHTRAQSVPPAGWAHSLRLAFVTSRTALALGAAWSKSLDYWGVQLQQAGMPAEAGSWFQRALELNPENAAARLNLAFNEQLQRGVRSRITTANLRERFPASAARYDNWPELLSTGGPVDEPTGLFRSGRVFLASANPRQAAAAFARASELAPEWPPPKLWLAEACLHLRQFSRALALADAVQTNTPPETAAGLGQLLVCRVSALAALGRTNDAAAFVETFLHQHRDLPEVLIAAADVYGQAGRFEDELTCLQQVLGRDPKRHDLALRKGLAEFQLARFDDAIATFTKSLVAEPASDRARLCRAAANLAAGNLDAAHGDYEHLLGARPELPGALFGLGSIAWRRHDTNLALGFFERCVSNAPPGSPPHRLARQRLDELRPKR